MNVLGAVVEQGSTGFAPDARSFSLHAAIYAARPDIRCIVRLHTPAAAAVRAADTGTGLGGLWGSRLRGRFGRLEGCFGGVGGLGVWGGWAFWGDKGILEIWRGCEGLGCLGSLKGFGGFGGIGSFWGCMKGWGDWVMEVFWGLGFFVGSSFLEGFWSLGGGEFREI